jgi:hypothetical protein
MELQESVFYSRLGKETNIGIADNTKILTQWVPGTIFPGGKPANNLTTQST